MAKDYYEILGIAKSASSAEIKKAYLKLAKQYHPDHNQGNKESEKKFQEVSQAYEVLRDEQKRAAYDAYGHAAYTQGGSGGAHRSSGFNSADINDIFSDFFNDFRGRGARTHGSSEIRGSDLKYSLTIDLEEAFKGTDKTINFSTEVKCSPCNGEGSKDKSGKTNCSGCGGTGTIRMQQGFFTIEQTCSKCGGAGQMIKNPCDTCHGSGRVSKSKSLVVNVPAGIENNTRIRIAGEGEAGIRGGASGDLYVFVSIKPHNLYKIDGSDLHFKLPINFTTAALGGEMDINTIDGSKVELKIPAGTETGDMLKLKGKGMSKIRSSMRGDLYAHAFIPTPKNLTKKQRELIAELDKELGAGHNNSDNSSSTGFFDKMKNIWN